MGAAEVIETTHDDQEARGRDQLALMPEVVEVRRNAGLAAALGAGASALAIAYLSRAVGSGAALDWVFAIGLGALGGLWLATFLDARTPLLVADAQGVRIRLGRTWRGLPWSAVERVEHTPRRGLLHDGLLTVQAHNEEKVLDELDAAGRRRARLATRLHGAPLAVPLGLATRLVGTTQADLGAALETVAQQSAAVVVVDPRERDDAADLVDKRSEDESAEPVDLEDVPHAHPSLRDPLSLIHI